MFVRDREGSREEEKRKGKERGMEYSKKKL